MSRSGLSLVVQAHVWPWTFLRTTWKM